MMTIAGTRSAAVAALLLWLFPTGVLGSIKLALANGQFKQCQSLWAKQQTIQVGTVCIDADQRNPEQLIVSYETRDGWKLDDAHFWVGRNESGIPTLEEPQQPVLSEESPPNDADDATRHVQQQKENQMRQLPDLTQFPYKKEDLSGKFSNFGFVVKLFHLGYACPDPKGTEFLAVAHATVTARSSLRNGNLPTKQSAWASESSSSSSSSLPDAIQPVMGADEWQNFSFKVVCDIKNDPPKDAPQRHHANTIPQ